MCVCVCVCMCVCVCVCVCVCEQINKPFKDIFLESKLLHF